MTVHKFLAAKVALIAAMTLFAVTAFNVCGAARPVTYPVPSDFPTEKATSVRTELNLAAD
jgi:hypothetical protein